MENFVLTFLLMLRETSFLNVLLYFYINYSDLREYWMCVAALSMQTIYAHVMGILMYFCIILKLAKKKKLVFKE